MKKIFAIAAVGALALPSLAFASVFGCNGCTPQQMADLAWSELYSPGGQAGYIVNLANGTVAKYTNIANIPDPFDPEPPPYEPNVIEVPVEPLVANLIHDLYVMTSGNTRAVYAPAAEAALSKSSAQPASGDRLPVNAYEGMMDADLGQRVAEMVKRDTQDIDARISFFVADNVQVARHFDVDALPLEVTFHYRDGSTAKYQFVWRWQKWERIATTSRDGRYNTIPEGKQDLSRGGNYDFSLDTGPAVDIDWFRWLVESFGVPVIDMRPSLGGGGGIVCVDNVCYIQIF